jgi:glyoxylase-like metal-dependent hydrolase (beta-lactamase superfamily II)
MSLPSRKYATAIAALICVLMPAPAGAGAPQVRVQAPGYYRMMLGDFEVTALLDGTHPFPVSEVLMRPVPGAGPKKTFGKLADVRPGEAEALLASADLKTPVEGSINAFLINTGTRLILIDSGAGSLYGACCGNLVKNLEASGYQPEQVDEIYLTHLHADHVGGVAPNGKIAFANATVRASKLDIDYWLSPANEAAAPQLLHPMFEGAMTSLRPFVESGRLKPFEGEAELSPGIRAIPAPGHTPGHSFYEVESRGQKLVLWGDIVHVGPIQFPDPAVAVAYDSDGELAKKQREEIFADAAQKGYWVGAAHLSFPGLGHVSVKGSEFLWSGANYTTVLHGPGK